MNVEGAESALGLYLNTLPIRIEVDARSVEASVRDAQVALAELMRHEHASLASAQRCSGVAAPAPLFTSLLNYRHFASPPASRSGIELLSGQERTNYPLSISVNDEGDALSLSIQAVPPLSPDCMGAMMERALEQIAEALEHAPARPLRELDVLDPAERTQLAEWNATARRVDEPQAIYARVAAQVTRTPEAIAIADASGELTYRGLAARIECVAGWLAAHGVTHADRVAISLDRTADMVVAVLAVLRIGAAYVPIDPSIRRSAVRSCVATPAPCSN